MAKNPLHPHWRVEWRSERAATLDELASWLHFEDMIPETIHDAMTGAGRNVMVFDDLRAFGYREVLRYKREGKTAVQFLARLNEVASGINNQFPSVLPISEVRAIAKSVAKWTWQRFSPERFGDIQRHRIQKRWAGHASVEVSRPWSAEGISRATWYRRKGKQ